MAISYFRFYEELNDFLSPDKRKIAFPYQFQGNPSIKDAIESIGVPHTEIDLILVNSASVGFDYHLKQDDQISVYPVFESLDISPIVRLREQPLRHPLFILDTHLGKLARLLRMLGFDCLYRNDYTDREIVRVADKEKRVILTRDRGVLKYKTVTHGYCVRSKDPEEQIREVLKRFDLYSQIKPFHRCMVCNGIIETIDKAKVLSQLPPKTKIYFNKFFCCSECGKVYWKGSHYRKMESWLQHLGGD